MRRPPKSPDLAGSALGHNPARPKPSRAAQRMRDHVAWDLLCGCCAMLIHSLHFASMVASVPARQLAPLLAQLLLAALTLAWFVCRRELYSRCRPLFTVAVRLGMVSLPAITLNAAYRANVAPLPGTPLALLAWRVLLASRACVLLIPAISRRTRLIPQVALSLLALWLARQFNEQTCAAPLFQDDQVLGLLSGITQFARALASPGQLGAAEPGAAATAAAAAAADFSCTQVVAFLQLAIGVVAPTALYLWHEGEMARQYTASEEEGARAGWELRVLAWIGSKRAESGAAPFLLPSLAAVAGCWVLSGML